ncbi:hypothetical protein K439DRAFT_1663257 [Ramaria rubella]|nr:hypothetical protein K439DRAFT_1663257 [Ramaria rubella]
MPKPPVADVDVDLVFLLFVDTAVEGLSPLQDAPMLFRGVAKPKDAMLTVFTVMVQIAWCADLVRKGQMQPQTANQPQQYFSSRKGKERATSIGTISSYGRVQGVTFPELHGSGEDLRSGDKDVEYAPSLDGLEERDDEENGGEAQSVLVLDEEDDDGEDDDGEDKSAIGSSPDCSNWS